MKEANASHGEIWNPREGVLARASIMSSALLIEAAANVCIHTLNLPKSYYVDIDRLPVISKFEYFLEHAQPNKRLDRGSLPVQKAHELVEIRNLLVHPKPYPTKLFKEGEHTLNLITGQTSFLKIPKCFSHLQHNHALVALKAAMSFLNYFFKNLSEFSQRTTLAMLTSKQEPPISNCVITSNHNPQWIEWHEKWGIEIGFLIDVPLAKEGQTRSGEH
jgi:hypothetical protein